MLGKNKINPSTSALVKNYLKNQCWTDPRDFNYITKSHLD